MGKISARTMSAVGMVTVALLIGFAAFASLSAMRNGNARPAIPQYGNIFQSGALVGWATGAKMSADGAAVEFDQISHARQLLQHDVFEYGGQKMRISHVVQVDYLPGSESAGGRSTARPDKTLVRVTARIQPSR